MYYRFRGVDVLLCEGIVADGAVAEVVGIEGASAVAGLYGVPAAAEIHIAGFPAAVAVEGASSEDAYAVVPLELFAAFAASEMICCSHGQSSFIAMAAQASASASAWWWCSRLYPQTAETVWSWWFSRSGSLLREARRVS